MSFSDLFNSLFCSFPDVQHFSTYSILGRPHHRITIFGNMHALKRLCLSTAFGNALSSFLRSFNFAFFSVFPHIGIIGLNKFLVPSFRSRRHSRSIILLFEILYFLLRVFHISFLIMFQYSIDSLPIFRWPQLPFGCTWFYYDIGSATMQIHFASLLFPYSTSYSSSSFPFFLLLFILLFLNSWVQL